MNVFPVGCAHWEIVWMGCSVHFSKSATQMDSTCLRVFTLISVIAFAIFHDAEAQNQPPVWDTSSILVLREGIREDTPIGTVLTKLKCNDAEDDKIEYRKTKGTAINVRLDGTVILAQRLDFEDKDTIGYDLAFSCYDLDNGFALHRPVELEVDMTVDDANDIAPEFSVQSRDGYTFFVSEDAERNLRLQPQIEVVDGDRGLNAQLLWLDLICESTNSTELSVLPETSIATCQKFRLRYDQLGEGLYNATLILRGSLDFETRPVYSSKLVAIDNPEDTSLRLSTTINIQIRVKDAQDVDPEFTNVGVSAVVSEGATRGDPVNLYIQARDGDTGDKRPVKIVMDNDVEDAFTLDESELFDAEFGIYQSRLIVKNPLDREKIFGTYDFTVKVIELDKDTLVETTATATATYSIQVEDIDDETPTFEQDVYSVNVTEMEYTTQAVQITGLRMVCTDADEPQNAKYNVRIVSQTFDDVFSISPGLTFTGTAILFLTVNNVRYIDYDVPSYRKQTVVVMAESTGPNALSSSTTVSITLTDINDNKPQFLSQNYNFIVSEGITNLPFTIDTITAQDSDSGENGRVTYRLEGGTKNKFEIDPTTGELKLVSRVDYETTPLYVFLVYAEDHGRDGQVSQVQVTVEVENANDLYPVFEQPIYQTSINEDKLDFLSPINIRAYDNEDGATSITYRITKGQTADNAFNLDRNTGSLTLNRKLNYGENGIYKLEVEASDNGSPPLTVSVEVIINVIDQNDFKPVIDPDYYTNTVTELVRPGIVVADILGSDADKGEFGKITYRISSGAFDNFVINSETGVVTVNDPQNLDFDQKNTYNIKIIGSDGGAPQLTAEATLAITVTDSNNKNPAFNESIYIATVDEVQPINYVILRVHATDPDSTNNLFYSIQENSINARNGAGNLLTNTNRYNYKEALGVDGTSGTLFIKNKLDKEEALEITLIVQVEDMSSETGTQTATTRVSITVTGEVNRDLKFNTIEQIFVNEGSPKGYEITTVVARDPTSAQSITNYLQIEDISPYFEVLRTTGQLRIKKEIDYETDPRTHTVVIKATADDGIRFVSATVTIKVNDDNDNAPEFDQPEYVADVDEDAPPLTSIVNIYATDKDTPSFGPIKYSIAGGLDSDNFELYASPRGVDVLVARGVQLDFNKRDYYELDVVALDNPDRKFSNVQKFASVKLKITVIDKNNHKPIFVEEDEGIRKMAVAESATKGTNIGTIVAIDDDVGVNGEITFDLRAIEDPLSERAIQLFRIVPRAGIIVVAADSLLGSGGKIFKFEVFARDGGEPYLSNTLPVEVEVLTTENNDGNPIWYRPANNYIFYAPEQEKDYVVAEKGSFETAARIGESINYVLSNLSSNAESFSLDKTTGELTIVDSLDRERKESYKLLVYAVDAKNSTYRTGRQIIIRLTDNDDNIPTFINERNYPICGEPIDRPFEFSFYEEVPKNQLIYQLKACDPDTNSRIYYFPYFGNPECSEHNATGSLRVETDGKIITDKNIDYEVDHTFTMCVIALDNEMGKKPDIDFSKLPFNVAYIIFHVKDVNDNGPKFPDDERSAVMVTDARDLPIIVLDAEDRDGKGFNVPIYSIIDTKFYASGSLVPTDPGKAFVMKNNEVHPDPPRGYTFQSFAKGRFVLTIEAEDPDNQMTDTQNVTIYVHTSGQAMKVILDLTPGLGIGLGEDIVRDLTSSNPNYVFRYLHVSVHENRDGIDKDKTDVCFIAVDRNTHKILTSFELINVLARREFKSVLNEDDYHIDGIGKCYPSTSSEERMKWKDLWWVLVILAIFIGFCAICFTAIIIFMHRKYRKYMETEKHYPVPQ